MLLINFVEKMTRKTGYILTILLIINKNFLLRYNYLVGACASAGVFGAWRRSAVAGFTMCIFFCKRLQYIF